MHAKVTVRGISLRSQQTKTVPVIINAILTGNQIAGATSEPPGASPASDVTPDSISCTAKNADMSEFGLLRCELNMDNTISESVKSSLT